MCSTIHQQRIQTFQTKEEFTNQNLYHTFLSTTPLMIKLATLHTTLQNIPQLKRGHTMNIILETHTIIKSKRKPRSLKRFLMLTQVHPTTMLESLLKECRIPNCGIYISLVEELNGQQFTVNSNLISDSRTS